jgi:hypothetical protein
MKFLARLPRFITTCAALLATAMGGLTSARAAWPAPAIPVEGPSFLAELRGVDEAGVARFTVDGEDRFLPLAELVVWGAPGFPSRDASEVLLADGGIIAAESLALTDETLVVESSNLCSLELPLGDVAAILFRSSLDQRRRDAWVDRLTSTEGDADRMLLDNDDVLTGTLVGLEENALRFASAAGEVQVDIDRVIGLAFNPRLVDRAQSPLTGIWIGLKDGGLIRAASMTTDDGQAQVRLPGERSCTCRVEDIVSLRPLGGRVTYLSDLPVAGYKHVPYLELSWPPGIDRSTTGTRLRAGGRLCAKGIGLHSTSRLTFRLDRPWRRLQAEICLDDAAGPVGSVVFRVFVDKEERYASSIVRAGDPPLPMDVDVTGGKTVSLIVDFAERGDAQDHADWLNARLIE